MVQPNTRLDNTIHSVRPEPRWQPRNLTPPPTSSRIPWGFACSAALSLATLALLFRPWLTARGPKGYAAADAFGRTTGVADSSGRLRGEGIDPTHISGSWGAVTAAAAVMTAFAVLIFLRRRSAALALTVLGSSATMAFSALCTVLYLNAKTPGFEMLVESSQTSGGLLGLLSGTSQGSHEIASAHLEFAALLGLIAALGAVMVAAVALVPPRAAGRITTPAPHSTPAATAVPAARPVQRLAVPTPTTPPHDTSSADTPPRARQRPRTAPVRTTHPHTFVAGRTGQLPRHRLPDAGGPDLVPAGSTAER